VTPDPIPMKRRRLRVPGMPPGRDQGGDESPIPQLQGEPDAERPGEETGPVPAIAAQPGDEGIGETEADAHDEAPDGRPLVNLYAGAGTTSLNVRLLVPLHARYRRLVRELEDEGYRTSSTELFHALLHFGPEGTGEARELLRRWRAVLDADPPGQA
jgi:hypothetical protein